jgi:NADPH-dependent F420 reductase
VAGDSIRIAGETNEQAAEQAEIIILAIPYAGVGATVPALLDAVQGKIVVSAVAPVEFEEGRPVARRVEAGSAAQEVAQLLPGSRVVSAFQTVDAHVLADLDRQLDTDVLVASDDAEARHRVMQLAGSIEGVRALSAGRLASSRYVEECTALLITLNRIYKTHAGIRITGVNR